MKIVFMLLVFAFLTAKSVYAYLDPGSGSYLLQILIGAVLGGFYVFRNFFKNIIEKITKFFKKIFKIK
jgi:hypothetical protein